MNYASIIKSIKSGDYRPIYLLQGEEVYFIDQVVKAAENILDEGMKSFNLTVFYGKDADPIQIKDTLSRFPMMAPYQVVILKEAQLMRDFEKHFEAYSENPVPTSLFFISYRGKTIDGRKKVIKNIKNNGVVLDAKKLYDNQLPEWLNNITQEFGYKLSYGAQQLIAEYLGADLSKFSAELTKLSVVVPKGTELKEEHVEKYFGISREYNVFELQKALGLKNREKVAIITKYFIDNEKNHPLVMIVASLYSYFSKLYLVSLHKGKSDSFLQGALNMKSSYFLRDYKQAAENYSSKEIEQIFRVLRSIDLRSKGVGNIHVKYDGLLSELIYKILEIKIIYLENLV